MPARPVRVRLNSDELSSVRPKKPSGKIRKIVAQTSGKLSAKFGKTSGKICVDRGEILVNFVRTPNVRYIRFNFVLNSSETQAKKWVIYCISDSRYLMFKITDLKFKLTLVDF